MMGANAQVMNISEGVVVSGFINVPTHIDLLCTPTEQAQDGLSSWNHNAICGARRID